MPPRHHRRSRIPFVGLALALALVAGTVVAFRLVTGHGRGAGTNRTPAGLNTTTGPSTGPRTSSPTPSRTTPVPRGALVIHGTGDVNVDPSYIPNFRAYGYGYAWSGLNGLFRRDDLTVINLECAVSDLGAAVPKAFTFRGDPAALPAMKKAGVEVANMGNNHSYDFGPAALVDTRRNLVQAGIAPVGAGRDGREALSPATFEIEGWRVAVVGFDKVVDPYPEAVAGPGHPGTAAGHDLDAMVRAVKAASADADLTVVIVHWGVELDTQPRSDDVELAHRFIDAGADVIFGGHSHRLQPMGTYRNRPIFYSLGNFVWPNFSAAGATTAVAEVKVTSSGKFVGRLIPAYIESAGHPVLRGS
jgi:poly-gamma-glutamate capsule biosynthesis protein CapA/YwtB (metallophosphatase superfamily)